MFQILDNAKVIRTVPKNPKNPVAFTLSIDSNVKYVPKVEQIY